MEKILAPIKAGDKGLAVANLQQAMLFIVEKRQLAPSNRPLGFWKEALTNEISNQLFGERTGQLLSALLPLLHILPAGFVTQPIADALNKLLADLGGVTPPSPPSPSPPPPVEVDHPTLKFTVDGKVFSSLRAGVDQLRVQILDKNVGNDIAVAETTTNTDGSYHVDFTIADLLARGKERPDLQAKVLAGQVVLGASEVRYNASNQETLNILLPETTASALPSEYETLTGAVSAHFKGNLRDLQESDDRQDITYLANKTGWDARAVALAALADQFSQRTADADGSAQVPAPFFYALFRAGVPANDDAIYHTDGATVSGVWSQATKQGVIPKTLTEMIPTVVEKFQTASTQNLLNGSVVGGVSPFKEMLAISGLNEAQQEQFATIYTTNRTDTDKLWTAVTDAFGTDLASRLQVDGKLGFLTINNPTLIQALHKTVGDNGLKDPLELAQLGYYKAAKWTELLNSGVSVPDEIPGDVASKQKNYAEYLAAQVRLSYPTAAMAEMVKSGELPLTGAASGVSDQVHAFLAEQQGKFEIGVQPVQQYIAENNLQVADEVVHQVKRLQRVYQITPSDQALTGLMKRGIDAAYHVVHYDKDTFVLSFAADLGGADQAALAYDKSMQVHNAVLNVALSYLNARTAPAIGVHSPPSVVDPTPANVGDLIASATLESLFGSMDFCACDHCRSILSPAAYLVDLLQFLGSDDKVWADFVTAWKSAQGAHEGAPYPFPNQAAFTQAGSPPNTEISPFEVLMSRRPDIQNLPLTCENTNTALPYIDVVNETLEYFIANGSQELSLKDYQGHDTNGAASEDLLASPQFVMEAAYATLATASFPAPLPFQQPLENLRRYFSKFEVPLPLAMERLRKTDDLERGTNPYGWRDILMEEIGVSRAEYDILTDSNAVPLWRMYGFPNGTADADVVAGLSNTKQFCRRIGITYQDLISILRARFINPNGDLIPKLERLGVSFVTLKAVKDGTLADSDFDKLLADLAVPPDPAEYGGDIKAWVKDNDNYSRIMSLITLTIPASAWTSSKAYSLGDCVLPTAPPVGSTRYYECTTAGASAATEPNWPTTPGDTTSADGTVIWTCRDAASCYSFDNMAFRYSDPAKLTQSIGTIEFVRLGRFIRLWKKLDWTIEQTDAAICALYRTDLAPLDPSDIDDVTKLNTGFLTLLPRLGIITRVMRALNLTVNKDLLSLLVCFAPIGTHDGLAWVNDSEGGLQQQIVPSLYRQMFLNPAILKQDDVFADNGYGEFLTDNSQTLFATNSTKKAKLAGKITPGDVLSTSINGLAVAYTVVAGDTSISTLATHIVSEINATTAADPITSKPLNDVIIASNASGIIAITIKDPKPDSIITLVCSVSEGATETYTPLDHESALCAAFNLTGSEFTLITDALNFDATTPLSIANISAIYRRGWLARKLKLSVRELLLLSQLTGLDPFAAPDPTNPAILQLICLVQALKDRSLKSAVVLYLIWNQDLSGKSAPAPAQITELARTLRGDFASIDDQFAAVEDPNGDVARARMTLVYGQQSSDAFFALLDDTLVVDVAYTHTASTLEPAIISADPAIAYDDFRHRLSHRGLVTTATQTALKNVSGVSVDFQNAVDALFARSEETKGLFFTAHPELKVPYDAAVAVAPADRHSAFLAAFDPELARIRKRQQALQRLSAAVGVDLIFTQTMLDPASGPYPLHAGGDQNKPALDDVVALETPGLAAQFFFRDTATGSIDESVRAAATLDYVSGGSNPLPNPGNAISGIWSGQIETPEAGFYNFIIETDIEATVTLTLDGQVRALTQNGDVRRNTDPIELKGGTLYEIELKVEKVQDALSLEWETPKQAREVVPSRYLYPPTIFEPFSDAYVRFLKTVSLAVGLGLAANEIAFFATNSDYQISADGWLNALSVSGNPGPATAAALLTPFEALLDFARIKADISPSDESLLTVLKDPTTATRNTDSPLFAITLWNQTALNDVLGQFGGNIGGLGHFDLFRRVYDAFALIQKMGISAKGLIQATTDEPTSDMVRDLQAALRARYDAGSWRDVVQPINDEMRALQRDALVTYILQQMRSHPESARIDTPDKLFEYFLMDVQMDPCMQTSRIRHALSSVQLFIERCLMNLEPRVSPVAINAQRWEWMKRYRVWEANRKVYLFPENWLEPELRDDKSPFFKEIESELLQSDITEDSATTAMLNYLSKLEEVAKLEPCGIHCIPADQTEETGEVDHVIARTAGAHRKYYYRRYEYGYWTPWEQIKLDIEDNPVIPVVWKDRLLLFWLRILKQSLLDPDSLPTSPGPSDGSGNEKSLANLGLSDVKTSVKQDSKTNTMLSVQAVLCWSEFYNSKWQAAKTSDVNNPANLGDFQSTGNDAFDRSKMLLSVTEEGDTLRVTIVGQTSSSFLLYNTHSLPAPQDSGSGTPYPNAHFRYREPIQGDFLLAYGTTADVPLYRLSKSDHFYTTSASERDNAIATYGYTDEGIACYVFGAQVAGTIPLYRLRKSDHFYTTSVTERDNAIATYGYIDEGVACYVYGTPVTGTIPLYRLSKGDHFYTTSASERDNAIATYGYADEGIACYVYGAQVGAATTLERDLLTDQIPFTIVEPRHSSLPDPWDSPFFFEDNRHVFYVTTTEQPVRVGNSSGYGPSVGGGIYKTQIPPLVVRRRPPIFQKFVGSAGPTGPDTGVIDPVLMQRLVTEDAYIQQGISTTAAVMYGGRQIGPSGAIANTQAGI
jgi:hypothetical protein